MSENGENNRCHYSHHGEEDEERTELYVDVPSPALFGPCDYPPSFCKDVVVHQGMVTEKRRVASSSAGTMAHHAMDEILRQSSRYDAYEEGKYQLFHGRGFAVQGEWI